MGDTVLRGNDAEAHNITTFKNNKLCSNEHKL